MAITIRSPVITRKRRRQGQENTAANENADENSALLEHLTCPVCMEYMAPPLMFCVHGHGHCNNCLAHLDKCTICRVEPVGAIQNLKLEKDLRAAVALSVDCPECGVSVRLPELASHRAECVKLDLGCPLNPGIMYDETQHLWLSNGSHRRMCHCRGLRTPEALITHLLQCRTLSLSRQEWFLSVQEYEPDTGHSDRWTIMLVESFATMYQADPGDTHQLPQLLLTTSDGHKILLNLAFNSRVGFVVLAIALTPKAEELTLQSAVRNRGTRLPTHIARTPIVPVRDIVSARRDSPFEFSAIYERATAFPSHVFKHNVTPELTYPCIVVSVQRS